MRPAMNAPKICRRHEARLGETPSDSEEVREPHSMLVPRAREGPLYLGGDVAHALGDGELLGAEDGHGDGDGRVEVGVGDGPGRVDGDRQAEAPDRCHVEETGGWEVGVQAVASGLLELERVGGC